MIVPSQRLLQTAAMVLLPAAFLPVFFPNGGLIVLALGFGLAILAAFDGFLSRSVLEEYSVTPEDLVRINLNEEQSLAIAVRRTGEYGTGKWLRIGLNGDAELIVHPEELVIREVPDSFMVRFTVTATRRGEFSIESVILGGPSRMGLWEHKRDVSVKCKAIVQIAMKRAIGDAIRQLALRRHGGQWLTVRSGRGREFEQLREYTAGDSTNEIDWKATARRRHPIVRQYQVERTQDIYLCVDNSRLSGQLIESESGSQMTMLDQFVRAAFAVEYAVRETGDRLGLLTFGNSVHQFAHASASLSSTQNIRAVLNRIQPELSAPAFDDACTTLRTRLNKRSLLLFLTNLGEPQLVEQFLEASSVLLRQHVIVVVSPADARCERLFSAADVREVDGLYNELAGHLLWKRGEQLRPQLRRKGIRVSVVPPAQLGGAATTVYLDIKERQLL
jgi:uncharacterized protein (DUF58 family)